MKKFILQSLLIFIIGQMPVYAITTSWWDGYGDEILVKNLKIVHENNRDLKIAAYKTQQMQDVVKMAFSNQLPKVGFNGDIKQEFTSSDLVFGNMVIPNYHQTNFLLPVSMSYEVDIWGKNYLATKSTKQYAKMVLQDEELTKIIVDSAFSANYFNLIKTDELIKNQTELVNLQKQIVVMQNKKYIKGLASKTETLQEQQLLTTFKSELNTLKERQELLKNQLIVMMGKRELKELERADIERLKLVSIPQEVSATVITKRPDYIKSELFVKKLGYDVMVAKRDFLPKFTLYGNLGFNAYSSNSSSPFLSNIGIAPSWNIFTGGYRLARYRYTKNECKKALEMYEKTVLISMQELNDSLFRVKTANKNYQESIENNRLETSKYGLTQKKYEIGALSSFENLKAQRNTFVAKNAEISSKINYLITTIDFYKALGGKNLEAL